MQFKWKQRHLNILFCLGLSLQKGGGRVFLVLDGMRLCECFDFLKMNCKVFHRNDRRDMYDCACNCKPLTSWWGWSICLKYGTYKHLSEIMGGGWEGQGWEGMGTQLLAPRT